MGKTCRYVSGIYFISCIILALILVSAGCTSQVQPTPDLPRPGSPSASRTWKEYPLEDLAGKGNFTIATFTGKTVLVPIVSVTCPTCIILLEQQVAEIGRIPGVIDGRIDVVLLDLDPSGEPGFIATYAARNNYRGYSAHSPNDLTLSILTTFGPFSIDTSAVPVIMVCPQGNEILLPPGLKTAEMLNATILEVC